MTTIDKMTKDELTTYISELETQQKYEKEHLAALEQLLVDRKKCIQRREWHISDCKAALKGELKVWGKDNWDDKPASESITEEST